MTRLHGVDGCRAGWVVVSSDASLGALEFGIIDSGKISDLFRHAAAIDDIIAIDIPIGLAESEPRACDRAARKYLHPPRASSVFPAPCRAALAATDHATATRLNFAASGRGLPVQAFHILQKIREVDAAISPALQQHVYESHPEVVFARLSGAERGLQEPKRKAAGRALRRTLLEPLLPPFDEKRFVSEYGPGNLAVDDLLDALACLITAHHILRGVSRVLPEGTVELDERGLRMEIVA